ncbi:hypothetical protein RHMOL_Rhmol08G0037100 [Rhododendron molle]|uniref:Uncharacterized protein n=1 Tax=Rhododendron molle TaxID=49168 RepID=A0ACC0MKS8_RHOML|nr:hypothetical protein RHMOL_Rhmol08G0037100 [Rhododendron molle]
MRNPGDFKGIELSKVDQSLLSLELTILVEARAQEQKAFYFTCPVAVVFDCCESCDTPVVMLFAAALC